MDRFGWIVFAIVALWLALLPLPNGKRLGKAVTDAIRVGASP